MILAKSSITVRLSPSGPGAVSRSLAFLPAVWNRLGLSVLFRREIGGQAARDGRPGVPPKPVVHLYSAALAHNPAALDTLLQTTPAGTLGIAAGSRQANPARTDPTFSALGSTARGTTTRAVWSHLTRASPCSTRCLVACDVRSAHLNLADEWVTGWLDPWRKTVRGDVRRVMPFSIGRCRSTVPRSNPNHRY